jgi:predicted HTH domain antitoxin
MKKTKVVPLRIPECLDEAAALKAEREHTDKATALRQWLYEGAENYVLGLLVEGRVSKGRSAELLGLTIYDINDLIEARGLDVGPSDEQIQQSKAFAATIRLPAKKR